MSGRKLDIRTVTLHEIKMGFRNPWAYTFLFLFAFFSLSLVLIQSRAAFGIQGYSHMMGTLMNLILYLLPLMTLLLGSISVTSEKEEGRWQLLAAYPISSASFLLGKYFGLAAVLLSIVGVGYGLSGMTAAMAGQAASVQASVAIFVFSLGIILLYLAISLLIGTMAKNRWQALTLSVAVWFVTILAWPALLIAGLGLLPYKWIQPVLEFLTLLNPAEFLRIFTVISVGGGSVFGPAYYQWVNWAQQPFGSGLFVLISLLWLAVTLVISILIWERGRTRD